MINTWWLRVGGSATIEKLFIEALTGELKPTVSDESELVNIKK